MAAEPAAPQQAQPEAPEVLVERERRERPRAAVAAAVGGVLSVAGALIRMLLFRDAPDDDAPLLRYLDEHGAQLVVSSALVGLGAVAIGQTLLSLFRATKGRRPELLNVARLSAQYAPWVLLVALVVQAVGLVTQAGDFAAGSDQSERAAKDALSTPAIEVAGPVGLAAQLALGFSFVIIALNAMRAGLLTRFMGVLGIIVGVLMVVPLFSPLPVVQTFWLIALAVLLAGGWPSGTPPAWERGQAVPWPSQQELRERGERERDAPEPAPATAQGAERPAVKKRKRKRRG